MRKKRNGLPRWPRKRNVAVVQNLYFRVIDTRVPSRVFTGYDRAQNRRYRNNTYRYFFVKKWLKNKLR